MKAYDTLSRADWLALADRYYSRLQGDLSTFTPSDWERPSPYLGWRNRDILAHMASATSVNFGEMLDRALAGNPGPPREFYTFSRNAREVARRRDARLADILEEFWRGIRSILTAYEGIQDPQWLAPAWFFVGPVNVRTLFLAQLADNVLHERDLMVATGRWRGLDPGIAEPLVDWLLREVRPSFFRPERAAGLRASAGFRLRGPISGEWTMTIAEGRCSVEAGTSPATDVTIEADTEDLIVAAQARTAPWVGRATRAIDWVRGGAHREDFAAFVAGTWSALGALLLGRVRLSGSLDLARRINSCFWQFWQRSEQTRRNIAAGEIGSVRSPLSHSRAEVPARRDTMIDRSSMKLGGFCAIAAGLSYLAIGVTFFLLPIEQQPASPLPPRLIFESVAAGSTMLVIYFWAFVAAAVFAIGAVPVVSDLVRAANPGWVRWASTLALIGYAVLAIEYLVLQDQVPKMAQGFLQVDESARAAISVIGTLNLNNDAWAGFGTVGLWLVVVNALAWRGGQWPKPLAAIGLIVGIGNGLVIAGFILDSPLLVMITAGLGAVVLGPIWFVWMGLRLRGAAGATE